MPKIVLFGLGKVFQNCIKQIDFKDVVCICDNNSLLYSVYGCEVVRPERLREFEFDYVVIFNKKNLVEIREQLLGLGIDSKRIVSWAYYLCAIYYKTDIFSYDASGLIEDISSKLFIDSVLDIDNAVHRFPCFNFRLKLNITPYEVRNNKNDDTIIGSYDAALFLDFFINNTSKDFDNIVKKLSNCRYLILTIPYACSGSFSEWESIDFSKYGYVKEFGLQYSRLIVIDTYSRKDKNCDIEIYTVTHKIFKPIDNSIYHPIFAGKTSENEMGIQGDADGTDIISCYNQFINECTALYWIWKNSRADIVGLAHYRRYIGLGNFWDNWQLNVLDAPVIHKLLKTNDMIVLTGYGDFPLSVKTSLAQSVNKEAFSVGFETVRSIVQEKYPDYIQDFDAYFNGFYMHQCNMFIAKKALVDQYCAWLFDIIIPAVKRIDISCYDSYSKRIIGFIAERLLTLWIIHNDIKTKEMPLVMSV